MTASVVSLANRAIQILGSTGTIESVTQDHPNARTMNRVLEPRRRALLRKGRWGFAITRASVAADGSKTLYNSLNRFALPNDYIRLLLDGDVPSLRKDWKIEGRFIVTADASPLEFRYIADILDPSQWDALFFEYLAHDMAHETAKEVTGNDNLKESIKKDMKDIMADARKYGAFEEEPAKEDNDDWLDAMR